MVKIVPTLLRFFGIHLSSAEASTFENSHVETKRRRIFAPPAIVATQASIVCTAILILERKELLLK